MVHGETLPAYAVFSLPDLLKDSSPSLRLAFLPGGVIFSKLHFFPLRLLNALFTSGLMPSFPILH